MTNLNTRSQNLFIGSPFAAFSASPMNASLEYRKNKMFKPRLAIKMDRLCVNVRPDSTGTDARVPGYYQAVEYLE